MPALRNHRKKPGHDPGIAVNPQGGTCRFANNPSTAPPQDGETRPFTRPPRQIPEGKVHTMYARIVRAQVPPEHFDQVLAATKERNVPMVTQFPGFTVGYWAADRHAGIVATVVLLDSEEGIRAAEAGMEQMRPLIERFGVRLDSVENLQVLITETAEKTT
jgi:hypothetical protein